MRERDSRGGATASMEPIDILFIAVVLLIAIYLADDDSGGGRRGRLPNASAA